MKKCTLVSWPQSQLCIGCEHGEFVMGMGDDDGIGASAYLCYKAKEVQDMECEAHIIDEGETPEDYIEEE